MCVHVHNASPTRTQTYTGAKRTNLIKFFHFVHESCCCIISLLANAITYSLVSLHFSVGSLLYLPDCVPVSPIPNHSCHLVILLDFSSSSSCNKVELCAHSIASHLQLENIFNGFSARQNLMLAHAIPSLPLPHSPSQYNVT